MLATFPDGNLPEPISQVPGQVDAAWNFCVASNTGAANGQITAAVTSLQNAASGGDISQADADSMAATLQALADCETGPTVDWPPEWSGCAPPYEGGNTEFAIKIQGGSELLQPLTFVTALPAYIQGDYNSIDKQPAAVIADAITILSNAWSDDDLPHSLKGVGNRQAASPVEQSHRVDLGRTRSYNGGVENLPRFLEKWSGRTFTFR